ncbi:acylphosphatase [Dongia rigui]|uniref:acylphosphatase n=1 Tax=Dongia rigui TaxID=940149 RepID=A0ABU5E476_9PROT|nr:acylphosphatase [Dongia rigui]MDY0874448.1 acylphosphatase [Dongia rigui]
MADTAKLCRIGGKVQNVWYRAWTVQQAEARGLNGWVRNLSNGDVEALFAGPADKVADMIAACHEGPKAARVANVAVEDFAGDIPEGFTQTSDA